MAVDHLNVNEWFGPTIQGEGRNAGVLASFLRLSGCNLSCSFCDTPYTWDWERFNRDIESRRIPVTEVFDTVRELPGRLIISGGEPLIQRAGLEVLLEWLNVADPRRPIDLETNGTRPLGDLSRLLATITCSPKMIPSAGQPESTTAVHPEVLASRADFKFVVANEADLDSVLRWRDEHARFDLGDRIWVMPEGVTHEVLTERTPWLMNAAAENLLNFTSRLHIYGWAEQRGR